VIRHPEYTRARLAQVSERLRSLVHPETCAPAQLLDGPPVGRISREEAQILEYQPAELGRRFGPLWATYWFRGERVVPEEWAGSRIDLLWDSASEATLWLEGEPAQGLNPHHLDAVLLDHAAAGDRVAFEVELACNGLFGRQEAPVELRRCELARFDPHAWRLYHDFETLRLLAAEGATGLDPAWAGELEEELNRFSNTWDAAILAQLLERRNAAVAHELHAVGHAHLDTAWLWPLDETYRKAIRTFTTQLRYLDEYPGYRFVCSQAQQYAWIRDRAPALWQRLRAAVEAGRFVPVGGTWIEPDCNIPSGESLVRQFLYGQRFFERELGRRCTEFWNPDVFGYNGQLPQIMRGAAIDRFLTQKLSWNRFTRPEHHTFTWQGIDGSEVLTHFPPADTYSAEGTPGELRRNVRDYKDHRHSRTSLLVFGHGDGGGGPTRTTLEMLERSADLQGLPRTRFSTPDEFFAALEAEPAERPTVVGELYLEYHRGTYTTQARTKRGNRRCEVALHDAEFLCAAAGGEYPRAELERLWQLLLLQQFHDILPGSSIGLVYGDAERDLAEVEAGAEAISADALERLGGGAVNTTGFARRDVFDGLRVVEAPPYGPGRVVDDVAPVSVEGLVLENEYLRAELSPDGSVTSLIEKACGRETLVDAGNRLELYDDLPVAFDAWDIDPFHLETRSDCPPASSYEVVATGPFRAAVRFERAVGDASRLAQTIRLDAGSRRLEFHTTADWHETHKLLKVCFPLAVRSPRATYEMQFGYAERPTHFSTSRDAAMYEVPGHRFADLSEHGFGAALLTDSKYGYSCFGGELRISLLRSPKSPDPEADMGRHEFVYAVLPHRGGWREGGVLAEAVCFNQPLRAGGGGSTQWPAFATVEGGLVLDTIKRAEDSDALVLRLYEPYGARGIALVALAVPVESARFTNLLEDEGAPLELDGGAIRVPFRPHQILTLKVTEAFPLPAPAGGPGRQP
jgi:alpha-mannosidase